MDRHLDLFTDENRREIVRKCLGCNNFEFVDWKIAPFSEDINGFLGEHLRGKFEVMCANGERKNGQVFIKVKPSAGSNEEMARLASEAHAFATETFYLLKLSEEENTTIDWAPRLILAKPDVLVFDDLSVKNFEMSHVAFGDFDVAHCTTLLKALARFHAYNFSMQEKFAGGGNNMDKFYETYSDLFEEGLFNLDDTKLCRDWMENGLRSIDAIIDVLPENYCLTPNKFKQLYRKHFYDNLHVVYPSKKYTNVVCHGDLWMKNMLFKYTENKPSTCCLLDFQLLRYAPPISDVIEFLFINTTYKFRKNHLHNLLKFYHEKLEKNLKNFGCATRISYGEIYASAQEQIDFFKIASIFYKTILELGDNCINDIMKTPGAYQDMMFYNRDPFLLTNYKKNPKYRAKIIEYMIEVREMLTSEIISCENAWGLIQSCFGRSNFSTYNLKNTSIGSRLGYLGDHYNLLLSVNLDGTPQEVDLFMKCMPKSKGSLTFLSETGGFGKETYFYGKILRAFASFSLDSLFNAAVAKCYWYNPQNYLIFENLAMQGFKTLDKYRKIDLPIAKAMMVTLAKFNAASYIYEEKMSKKLNRDFRIDEEFTIVESYYVKDERNVNKKFMKNMCDGLLVEIDLLLDADDCAKENYKKKTKILMSQFADFVKPMSNIRNVICNGDLWANNVLISDGRMGPVQCRLVDFQTWRYTSPAHDIVTFLFFTSTEAFRARYTKKLLEVYYQVLTEELHQHEINVASILTMEQLQESYNVLQPFAAAQAAIFEQFIMINSENINILFEEDRPDLIFGDRIQIISENCHNDAKYKKILTESIRALCNTL